MKRFALVLALGAALAPAAQAIEYNQVQADKSRIGFGYKQMGVALDGKFKKFASQLSFDPAQPANAKATIEVDLASVDTGTSEANAEVAGKPNEAMAALVRVLAILAEPREAESEIFHPHVFIPALAVEDLFDDAFSPISESGAGTLAVGIRLQKTLRALSAFHHPEFRAAARHQSRLALARARQALALAEDVARLTHEAVA